MTKKLSLAESHAAELLRIPPKTLGRLRHRWDVWARPEQKTPPGLWRLWLILAGRGWGKTRTGAEAIREAVEAGVKRIALVGATVGDVRDVMIDGESGLLAVFPKHAQPVYQTSKRRVVFHTGAYATIYTSEKPRRLRGPQHELAWADELAAWSNLEETWTNLDFGLRLGDWPRAIITTTPRPLEMLKAWIRESKDGSDAVEITRGRTLDNARNIPPKQLARWLKAYAGTRLGRQELEGELLEDLEGALFRRAWIQHDVARPPPLSRVVVAVDPAISTRHDETGIVVVGRSGDQAYVLADMSGYWTPNEWGQKAAEAARRTWFGKRPVCIVAETNRGGDLVPNTIRTFNKSIPIKTIHSDTGKDLRAEPIAALYEQLRVHHLEKFEKLETQMTTFDPRGVDELRARKKAKSPDRLDALVHGLTELGFHVGLARMSDRKVALPRPERTSQRGAFWEPDHSNDDD